MVEIIGFLVWILITMWITAAPFAVFVVSALGNGLKLKGKILILSTICLSGISWYYIFTSLTITLN
tara:strand:+ start:482 stop:679 length:198 start_codon:yes stop_codon:yes gene_type:complete